MRRRQTQRLSQEGLTAAAQNTAFPKLNTAVAEYVAAGWKVFGVHSRGQATLVCVSKTFGNIGGQHCAIIYPNGRFESQKGKKVTWSWATVQLLADNERPQLKTAPAPQEPVAVAAPVVSEAETQKDIADKTAFWNLMETIVVPEGFTSEFKTYGGFYYGKNTGKAPPLTFVLTKAGDTEITLDQSGSGHTRFKQADGWQSFDRLGVEDSFYFGPNHSWKEPQDLNEVVAEQLARITERREYYKSAVPVPGLPNSYTVAPDKVEELKATLNTQGQLSFTPSGFGVGYCVTKKPTQGLRFGESRAKPELEAFLGIKPLYVHTLDCD